MSSIRAKVTDYLRRHPNQVVSVDELAAHLDLDPKIVYRSASYTLRTGQLPGLEVVDRGYSWRWRPPAEQEAPDGLSIGERLEVVGRHPTDGTVLVRSTAGAVYRLAEL